jgi:hypothetical protein
MCYCNASLIGYCDGTLTSIPLHYIQAHEGFLRQFLVDDKGCVLIACWGVPSASYPDNSERALEVCI